MWFNNHRGGLQQENNPTSRQRYFACWLHFVWWITALLDRDEAWEVFFIVAEVEVEVGVGVAGEGDEVRDTLAEIELQGFQVGLLFLYRILFFLVDVHYWINIKYVTVCTLFQTKCVLLIGLNVLITFICPCAVRYILLVMFILFLVFFKYSLQAWSYKFILGKCLIIYLNCS